MIRAILFLAVSLSAGRQPFDVVIRGGRVMDPESGLDAIRNVGIRAGRIAAVSERALAGKETLDATGMVVAPGFIDLHWHGQNPASGRYQAMDGVTAALELEIGVADLDRWYGERAGRSVIHFGASIGHPPVRMRVMGDPGEFLPSGAAAHTRATEAQISDISKDIERGLRRGAPAVGLGIAYTHGATFWEILEIFRLAAKYGASCHVHIRGASSAATKAADREAGLAEVIAASALSGAPLHMVHINSSAQSSVGRMLEMVADARKRGLDVTTEAYPYTAGATRIESAVLDEWTDRPEGDYKNLQWSATGERLTRETFLKYRKQGGTVIIHSNTEENVRRAVLSPLAMIASDGFDVVAGQGHPRSAGTFCRILRRYVREERTLGLMEALHKMSLMPAQRLEKRVPAMKGKGRLREGADADLVVFDAEKVTDRSTFEKAAAFSEGMHYVLVGGTPVVRAGKLVEGVHPGRAIRAAAH